MAEVLFFTAQRPQPLFGSASIKAGGGDQEKIRPENGRIPNPTTPKHPPKDLTEALKGTVERR